MLSSHCCGARVSPPTGVFSSASVSSLKYAASPGRKSWLAAVATNFAWPFCSASATGEKSVADRFLRSSGAPRVSAQSGPSSAQRRSEHERARKRASSAQSTLARPNRVDAATGSGTHRDRLVPAKSKEKERPLMLHTVEAREAQYTRLRQLRSHRCVPCAWHSSRLPKLRRRPAALQAAEQAAEQSMVPARGRRARGCASRLAHQTAAKCCGPRP